MANKRYFIIHSREGIVARVANFTNTGKCYKTCIEGRTKEGFKENVLSVIVSTLEGIEKGENVCRDTFIIPNILFNDINKGEYKKFFIKSKAKDAIEFKSSKIKGCYEKETKSGKITITATKEELELWVKFDDLMAKLDGRIKFCSFNVLNAQRTDSIFLLDWKNKMNYLFKVCNSMLPKTAPLIIEEQEEMSL